MAEDLYPLGTAVNTRFSEIPYLIAGYYPVDSEKRTMAKYVAVDSLLGFGSGGKIIMLEDSDITGVVSEGYTDPRGDEYRRNMFLMCEKAGLREMVQQRLESIGENDSSTSE